MPSGIQQLEQYLDELSKINLFSRHLRKILSTQHELLFEKQLKKQNLLAAQLSADFLNTHSATDAEKASPNKSSSSTSSEEDDMIEVETTASTSTFCLDVKNSNELEEKQTKYAFIVLDQALRTINAEMKIKGRTQDLIKYKLIVLKSLFALLYPNKPMPRTERELKKLWKKEEKLIQKGLDKDYKIIANNDRKKTLRKNLHTLYQRLLAPLKEPTLTDVYEISNPEKYLEDLRFYDLVVEIHKIRDLLPHMEPSAQRDRLIAKKIAILDFFRQSLNTKTHDEETLIKGAVTAFQSTLRGKLYFLQRTNTYLKDPLMLQYELCKQIEKMNRVSSSSSDLIETETQEAERLQKKLELLRLLYNLIYSDWPLPLKLNTRAKSYLLKNENAFLGRIQAAYNAKYLKSPKKIMDRKLNRLHDMQKAFFPTISYEEVNLEKGDLEKEKLAKKRLKERLLESETTLIEKSLDVSNMEIDFITQAIAHCNIHKNFTRFSKSATEFEILPIRQVAISRQHAGTNNAYDREAIQYKNRRGIVACITDGHLHKYRLPAEITDVLNNLEYVFSNDFYRMRETFRDLIENPHLSYFTDLVNSIPKTLAELDFRAIRNNIDPDLHQILIALLRNDKDNFRLGSSIVENLYQEFFAGNHHNHNKQVNQFLTKLFMLTLDHEREIFSASSKEAFSHKSAFAIAMNRLSARYEHPLRFDVVKEGENPKLILTMREELNAKKFIAHEQKVHIRRVGHLVSGLVALSSGVIPAAVVLTLVTIGIFTIPVGAVPILALITLIAGTFINYILFDSFYVPFSIRAFNKGFFTEDGIFRHIYRNLQGKKPWYQALLITGYVLLGAFIVTLPIIMFVVTVMSFLGVFPFIFPIIIGMAAMATFITYFAACYESVINFPTTLKGGILTAFNYVAGHKDESWRPLMIGLRLLVAVAIGALLTLPGILMVALCCFATTVAFTKNSLDFIGRLGFKSQTAVSIATGATAVSGVALAVMPEGEVIRTTTQIFPDPGKPAKTTDDKKTIIVDSDDGRYDPEKSDRLLIKRNTFSHPYGEDGYEKHVDRAGKAICVAAIAGNSFGNAVLAGPTSLGMATGAITSALCGAVGVKNVNAQSERQTPSIDAVDVEEQFRLFEKHKTDPKKRGNSEKPDKHYTVTGATAFLDKIR